MIRSTKVPTIQTFTAHIRNHSLSGLILKRLSQTLTLTLAFSLGACSLLPSKSADQSAGNSEPYSTTSATQPDDEVVFKDFSFEDDTLYDLLVAEIAAQRNQINIALLNYIQQARHTRDPAVIKRAINAAQFAKDGIAITELGLLWVEVEPDNPAAHQLMAYQYSIAKEYGDAIHHIDRVIELGGRISVESLAIGSQSLPQEDKLRLLELYEKLEDKHPESLPVRYSLAIVLSNLKQREQALEKLDSVIETDPNFEVAYVLKSNLLYEQGNPEATLDFAEDAYELFPKNHALGRLYASLLIDAKRLDDAEQVFGELINNYPQTPAFRLSLALVKLENKKVEEAATLLEALLAEGLHVNEAHFYLGRIDDTNKDIDGAVEHYLNISGGMHKTPARERAVYLLMQDGRYDEGVAILDQARAENPADATTLWGLQYKLFNGFEEFDRALATLNQALEQHPDSEELLYARAMWMEAENRLDDMEADLRSILELNPENAIAMNALGYTLADKTDRLEEALKLISMALKIKPDNPAIMDSMGWVLFRLGEKEEALVFLLNAFQKFSDGEVGAHLGEVLLSLNQTTEAYEVWQKALELNPEHPVLTETLKRLAPELLSEAVEGESQEAGSESSESLDSEDSDAVSE